MRYEWEVLGLYKRKEKCCRGQFGKGIVEDSMGGGLRCRPRSERVQGTANLRVYAALRQEASSGKPMRID